MIYIHTSFIIQDANGEPNVQNRQVLWNGKTRKRCLFTNMWMVNKSLFSFRCPAFIYIQHIYLVFLYMENCEHTLEQELLPLLILLALKAYLIKSWKKYLDRKTFARNISKHIIGNILARFLHFTNEILAHSNHM